jgi:hypothetical protein
VRLLHLAAALVLQPQTVIFMPERPVVRSDWEYQSLVPVPGRIQPSHLLRASSEPGLLNRTVRLCR